MHRQIRGWQLRPGIPRRDLINHVHISEPYLEAIQQRSLHKLIAKILFVNKYDRCISIEMKKGSTISELAEIMKYVREIFN